MEWRVNIWWAANISPDSEQINGCVKDEQTGQDEQASVSVFLGHEVLRVQSREPAGVSVFADRNRSKAVLLARRSELRKALL
jgi:hypothetical protein